MDYSTKPCNNLRFVSKEDTAAMLFIDCEVADIHEGLKEFMGCVLTHATQLNLCNGDFFDVTASAFKGMRKVLETFCEHYEEEETITFTLLSTFLKDKILYRFIAPPEFPIKEIEQHF